MTDSDFDDLLAELAEEPPVFTRLQALDLEDLAPEQQRRLVLFLRTQAKIRSSFSGAEAFTARVMAGARAGEGFVQQVMQVQTQRREVSPPRWKTDWLPWSVAAAACLMAFAGWWRGEQAGSGQGRDVALTPPSTTQVSSAATPSPRGAVGVLVNDARAVFASGDPRTQGFLPGRYAMTEGLAHVRLVNGTDLVLKAPVTVNFESAMKLHLEQGGLRARVPEQAHGFTVATTGVEYRDLGTEFIVNAGTEPGQSSMHVYDGEVEVFDAQGQKLDHVRMGKAVSFASGSLERKLADEPPSVPGAETVRYQNWQDESARMRQDPDLVACYSFERDSAHPEMLHDVKTQGEPLPGTIHGARWVSGRWPGKQALFFDRDEDYVTTHIPDDYRAFTVAVWVLLDRLDFNNNALFASDGWAAGAFHFNVDRQARLFGGVFGRSESSLTTGVLSLGVWSLVVMTVDEAQGTVQGWVNGRLVYNKKGVQSEGLRPGPCRIGSCLPPPHEGNPVRTIRGRIDELFIWKKALGEAEIARLYEKGNPDLLEMPPAPTPSSKKKPDY